ncbi:dicarboxylate/amino acid:cation symporter [Arcanobacterium phocisimile]|uniref:Dicarboxylate/amino acid:cation symporter n=1 Tax=Arcanobacterium phocisimile TaxID=1302235 RepID=A0ABX7IHK1_9ACTO|nr:dicarboxylate/amino acid:cation symporter [Arcanobacterium phocisimile]QRV02608.1 dicarboxylate/amino acid:cation symporter [Arcanobacterium phocisimile]
MEPSILNRLSKHLLTWIVVAIVLGALLGKVLPSTAIVPFATFNDIFGKFLGFSVPLIIVGLVTPAISDLGKSGGRWVILTVALGYLSTITAGLGTWGLASLIFPWLLADQKVPDLAAPENAVPSLMDATFTLPPVFGVLTALILAFLLGFGAVAADAKKLMSLMQEFREVIYIVIKRSIVPLLPLHVFGIFLNMSKSGQFETVIVAMAKVIAFAFILTIIMLLGQYFIAGTLARRNPFIALWNMRDAYATALGTASSAATIPVTLRSALKNGVSEDVAGFVVPLCATIHLAGSTIKITSFALALQYMLGMSSSAGTIISFIFMLGIIMIAAPGVPGGAITAAQSVVQGILSFTDPMYGIMVALYVAVDSFGTATNVTGDGAIAMIVERFVSGKPKTKQ